MQERKTALQSVESKIDFIIEQYRTKQFSMNTIELLHRINDIIRESKPQEKKDLIDARNSGHNSTCINCFDGLELDETFEEWFNDTFENEN